MDFQLELAKLRQQREALRFQFVTVELDIACTYCHIATNTVDRVSCYRNIANAERAYLAAVRFLDGNLNAAQNLEITELLARFLSRRARCESSVTRS